MEARLLSRSRNLTLVFFKKVLLLNIAIHITLFSHISGIGKLILLLRFLLK